MMEKNNKYSDHELDLRELATFIFSKLFIIFTFILFSTIISFVFSKSLDDIYTSSALLSPSGSNDSISSKMNNYSTLASFAGVSMPSEGVSQSQEAIAIMSSFDFFSKKILPNIKLENILAVKEWIPKTNTIIYDNKIFLDSSGKWIRDTSFPKTQIPSTQEAFRAFKESVSISIDKNTSFVTLSVSHQSPYIAKKWLDITILNINESMRQEKRNLAEKSIIFLKETSKTTNLQSSKDAISALLESQLKSLMLVSAKEDYVYKILESPLVPEIKSSPRRSLIVVSGIFLGAIIGLFTSIMMFLFKKED